MIPVSNELELLSQQINLAHRAAVQAELIAADLNEIGHPMLLTILQSCADSDRTASVTPSGSWPSCCISRRLRWQTH